MLERIPDLVDVLDGVKLLPRRAIEANLCYGYVPQPSFEAVIDHLIDRLQLIANEVHSCRWAGEVVLLIFMPIGSPCAMRITSSPRLRYEWYAAPRPYTAQTVWQRAQMLAQQRRGCSTIVWQNKAPLASR